MNDVQNGNFVIGYKDENGNFNRVHFSASDESDFMNSIKMFMADLHIMRDIEHFLVDDDFVELRKKFFNRKDSDLDE